MSQNLEGQLEDKNLIILWQPFLSLPLHLFLVQFLILFLCLSRSQSWNSVRKEHCQTEQSVPIKDTPDPRTQEIQCDAVTEISQRGQSVDVVTCVSWAASFPNLFVLIEIHCADSEESTKYAEVGTNGETKWTIFGYLKTVYVLQATRCHFCSSLLNCNLMCVSVCGF